MDSYATFVACGQVQGVGFRPYLKRLADEYGLAGHVCNVGGVVEIAVKGRANNITKLEQCLRHKLPDNAKLTQLITLEANADCIAQCDTFRITTIPTQAFIAYSKSNTLSRGIPKDRRICQRCIAELFDETNKRYRFPFINCTACGPRYAVLKALPYTRVNTSWSKFPPCAHCQQEFENIGDRRFHAEGIACPQCAPPIHYSFKSATDQRQNENETYGDIALSRLAQEITNEKVCAIKGVGGFHLVCDATSLKAVTALRKTKQRPDKPFAIMALNSLSLKALVDIDEHSAAQLYDSSAPITVMNQQQAAPAFVESCAPNIDTLGCLLPYSPIHLLLFYHLLGRPNGSAWLSKAQSVFLVVTSANFKGEAIIYDSDLPMPGTTTLGSLCDGVLDHALTIQNPSEDSVVTTPYSAPNSHRLNTVTNRMARGLAPYALQLSPSIRSALAQPASIQPEPDQALPCYPTILALGADLKHTFSIIAGTTAYISPQTGSLSSDTSCRQLMARVDTFLTLLNVKPDAIACDQHPDFFTSELATQLSHKYDAPLYNIQHHHAHIAAVLAEHRQNDSVLALAMDGMGYGYDGDLWGGECLLVSPLNHERLAHVRELPLPGGDKASQQIWRLGFAALWRISPDIANVHYQRILGENDTDSSLLSSIANTVSMAPMSSSVGRWFDAAASLINICQTVTYVGQGAMLLESASAPYYSLPTPRHTVQIDASGNLDLYPLLPVLIAETDKQSAASRFHSELIDGVVRWLAAITRQTPRTEIYIGGGCFQNRILTQGLTIRLAAVGITVISPRSLPSNDASIALGQAWVAAHLFERDKQLCV